MLFAVLFVLLGVQALNHAVFYYEAREHLGAAPWSGTAHGMDPIGPKTRRLARDALMAGRGKPVSRSV